MSDDSTQESEDYGVIITVEDTALNLSPGAPWAK